MSARKPLVPVAPPGMRELPYSDGEPMETSRHVRQMNILLESLYFAWRDRTDFYAAGNMFIYFSELQTKRNDFRGPDVFIVLGTDGKKERLSWVAWEEGGKLPDVVVELLSETTEHVDRGEKMRIYERVWRTGHYVLFDPLEPTVLEGFVLNGGAYEPIAPDARGDLPIHSVGLSLGVRLGEGGIHWLRWIGPEGEVLPFFGDELQVPALAAAAEANARADEARARADDERARADEARARAEAAEARVAELERRLRG